MTAIYLTREQILNMAKGGCEGEGPNDCHDVVIEFETGKSDGWMTIHSVDHLMGDEFEGSGVYFDANGSEHFSPGGVFVRSKKQDEFHENPEKWLDFDKRYKASITEGPHT
jgi:hypothetical protein